jgi:hypothetical protein
MAQKSEWYLIFRLILLTGAPNSGQAFLADFVASDPDTVSPTDIGPLAEAVVGLTIDPDCETQLESVSPAARFADYIGLDGWRAYAQHLGVFRDALWPQT